MLLCNGYRVDYIKDVFEIQLLICDCDAFAANWSHNAGLQAVDLFVMVFAHNE